MDKERSMRGPFVPLPGDVFSRLQGESPLCFKAYAYMVFHFFVERDLEADPEWAVGRIRASKREVAAKLGLDRSHFNDHIWPAWEAAGVVETREDTPGVIFLPRLYRKADIAIDPMEIKQMAADIEEIKLALAEMALLESLTPSGGEWRGKPSKVEEKTLQYPLKEEIIDLSLRARSYPASIKGSVRRRYRSERERERKGCSKD